jgi:hypothetical protein
MRSSKHVDEMRGLDQLYISDHSIKWYEVSDCPDLVSDAAYEVDPRLGARIDFYWETTYSIGADD